MDATSPDLSVDAPKLVSLILDMTGSEEFQRLQTFYEQRSLFNLLGVGRSEVVHSRVLRWLFDPSESHGLGSKPLRHLLEALVATLHESKQEWMWLPPNDAAAVRRFPGDLIDVIVAGLYDIREADATIEVPIPSDTIDGRAGRIDILVTLSLRVMGTSADRLLRIIVENKVGSKEHTDQTSRYWRWAEEVRPTDEFGARFENVFVFLSPVSRKRLASLTEPDCRSKAYIQTNYQMLIDRVLEPCRGGGLPPEAALVVEHYLRALGPTPLMDIEGPRREELVMGIGKAERELLRKVWEKHKHVLNALLLAKMEEPETDDDTRKAIETVVASNARDFSLYNVYWQTKLVAKAVKKTDVAKVALKALAADGAIRVDHVTLLRAYSLGGVKLIKRADEITAKETQDRRFRRGPDDGIEILGEVYYASGNIGAPEIEKLTELLARHFPGLALERTDRD